MEPGIEDSGVAAKGIVAAVALAIPLWAVIFLTVLSSSKKPLYFICLAVDNCAVWLTKAIAPKIETKSLIARHIALALDAEHLPDGGDRELGSAGEPHWH